MAERKDPPVRGTSCVLRPEPPEPPELPVFARQSFTSPETPRVTKLQADFHKVEKVVEAKLGSSKEKVAYMLETDMFINVMTVIIVIDCVCALVATDSRAMETDPPFYTELLSHLCLVIYSAELLAILGLKGVAALKRKSILFDAFCVLCSFLLAPHLGTCCPVVFYSLQSPVARHFAPSPVVRVWVGTPIFSLTCYMVFCFQIFESFGGSSWGFVRELRLVRVIRVMRVARILQRTRSLKELRKLVSMMATCMKTLGWSFIFCFAFMTFWAMLMVEFVHPLVVQMQQEAVLDCPECIRSTSSIMAANLLLFKTVIAGDSWGHIAVPVIEHSPATAIIFCGSLMTTVFGVLNLLIAVVVDSFAESRQNDVLNLAQELEHEHEKDRKYMERIFNRLDMTHSGDLTLEDLVKGAQTDPEFQSRLRVMDIDEADLEQLFKGTTRGERWKGAVQCPANPLNHPSFVAGCARVLRVRGPC
ncbi:unnamed protein product [Durusdinium trenchii]|uniref:Ion transport domain-containing protein n=1 Tax=Durusdinium trenchii TaxID=1381693 RepID=A0ABP0IU16_9DINO